MSTASSIKRSDLRKFGLMLGTILLLITAYQWWRHERFFESLAVFGFFFAISGILFPQILGWIYQPWMWVAEKIGFVMNRVILGIFYLLFFSPIALVRRIFNRDPLELKWDNKNPTYFKSKLQQPVEQFKNIF